MGNKSSKIEPISINKRLALEIVRHEKTGKKFYLYDFFQNPNPNKDSESDKKR